MGDVDVNMLTMEQYLALTRGNQAPGMVKPEIRNNVNISYDAIMLRVFPITLTRAAKRWIDRIPLGTINTWDLLKKSFIQSGSSDGIVVITSFGLCGGTHLDKECPLNEEVKGVKEVKYGEFGRSFPHNGGKGARYRVTEKENEGSLGVLPCQLLLKELNPGSFTLPCIVGSLNMYALANLVEIDNMSKKARRGLVENVLVKIDKFIFPYDFVVIDMLGDPHETMILGRHF
nr:hypothetical protein [Tanacetum cinerariifolium]